MADEETNNTAVIEETQEASVETPVSTSLDELFSTPGTSTPEPVKEGETPSPETEAATEVKEGEPQPEAAAKEETKEPEPIAKTPEQELTEKYESRLKETRDWTSRVNAENAQLKQQLAEQGRYLTMINKKLDGDWTEEDERAYATPPPPTPEQIAHQGQLTGKIAASREAAYKIYGKDQVESMLFADNAPFKSIMNDPIVEQKVLSSDAPVIEAMEILKVKTFYDKWGYETDTIEKNIRESVEKELTEKITQKVMKQLSGKQSIPTGIRDVRSSQVASESVGFHTPLDELFKQR